MNLIIARVAIHEMKESLSCLEAPSTNRSATGIGYSSLGVAHPVKITKIDTDSHAVFINNRY